MRRGGALRRELALRARGRRLLRAGDVPSPLVHFWSLAVEEQFYIVWPALLLGLWALVGAARRGGASAMRVLLVARPRPGRDLARAVARCSSRAG